LKELLAEWNVDPFVIEHDKGSEYKAEFQKYLEEKNVEQIFVEPGDHNKLGVINRFSRTLKDMITKYFSYKDTVDWVGKLSSLIDTYNNTPKSNLCNYTPNYMWDNHDDTIACFRNEDADVPKRNIEVGDTVRIKLKKKVFTKGYARKWTVDFFTVLEINGLNYILSNGESVRGDMLQVIPNPKFSEDKEPIEKKVEENVKKETFHGKLVKRLKREGLAPVDESTGEYVLHKSLRPIGKGISFIPFQ
jgi:hypothetical protein